MVSGIDSSAIAAGGNLNVLKKAMESEEAIMSSLINGMQGAQSSLQTQAQTPAQPAQQAQQTQPTTSTNTLNITA